MTDRKALPDPNETPEDVATLYSWANLHGAKYRDFSASRALTREKARQRVQQAIEDERVRVRAEVDAEHAAEVARAAEEVRQRELTMQVAARQAAEQAARQAAQEAAQDIVRQNAQEASRQAAQQAAQQAAEQARAAQLAAQQAQAAQQAAWQQQLPNRYAPLPIAQPESQAVQQATWQQQPLPNRYAPLPAAQQEPQADRYFAPRPPSYTAFAPPQPPQPVRPAAPPQQFAPMREDRVTQPRGGWDQDETRDNVSRPAWLTAEQPLPVRQSAPAAPEDTLQGSRDRITSRWFALKSVFNSTAQATVEPGPPPMTSRAPVLAVFSLAGGVGKTSLVATLGRALSARGERVLLVDTAAYGLLPFYFGARDQRPGVLRTFSSPVGSGDAPVQMVTIDADGLGPENAPQEPLTSEIAQQSRGVNRVIVDLATASGAMTRRILRMSPTILVPVVPDMNSVVSVNSIEAFFQRNIAGGGKMAQPYYLLNQFDPSLPLHLDVREVLREQLGDRLLPFALRRAPAVSEALAEGMTVMDYAPNSTVAEDFSNLAGWVKNISAPATGSFRGVRWSER
ncbi:MAG TPA: cellulose biosynthesis protein BcsQ [Acidobacteriaceae bacterium]|nr:cellulose biosynthesis protein BcsQ [Acidobacteriaceae bacterium]